MRAIIEIKTKIPENILKAIKPDVYETTQKPNEPELD